MTKVLLERESKYIRTLYTNGKEIEGYKFYNDNGILLEINCGWLEKEINKTTTSGKVYTSIEDMEIIELSQLRNARVEKFEKKDNFIIKGYVYIYCGKGGDFEFNEITNSNQVMGKDYIYYYKHYHMAYNGEQIAFKVFDRHEKTEYGSNLDNICKALNDKGLSISRYQVEKMLEMNLLNLNELA